MNNDFPRIKRLPDYVFAVTNKLKAKARARGEDIIDFGMGNPDQPTPNHIVEKLVEATRRKDTHRYATFRGIPRLRKAISNWYKNRFNVDINPETEAIVTIGSKEGLYNLAQAIVDSGDTVLVPNPAYPIHPYGFVLAGAKIQYVPCGPDDDFLTELEHSIKNTLSKPKMLVLNYPSNPTTQCAELYFFEKVIKIAKKHEIWVVQDLAYADIVFDGYVAPSILQVEGAKKISVEFFSLSKSYNMPGWRVGFMVGNPTLVSALAKIKSYLDYGMFTPIQIAAIEALEGDQSCVKEISNMYQDRRDVLCNGLDSIGWIVTPPKATMFVWAKIPEFYQHMGSLEFTKKLLKIAKISVSPGIGFGSYGDQYVRFGLIENEHRTRQAIRGIREMFKKDGLL
ncbi:alanine transaminase [Candidatus Vesicomyidisocius calyptogenae]|uniref:Aminotransferase n=1 Tax=Vesicomyosocius okutanii subsp. Calyptogena okutanii (strain HA) TaxID=412965 RepID=A5CY23_VESOH|nr:alanine transaminase [Candidatus Vesicomyosocius okutanii]BAF61158.1 aminotransferase [Candidatus Vesicomyosocius okutanii]